MEIEGGVKFQGRSEPGNAGTPRTLCLASLIFPPCHLYFLRVASLVKTENIQ